ncbi:MAG: hypothetical protein OWT27_01255, partial [Firmicutes bacterium]|nr:hypothetical protein [Bacillota bacterium]
MRSPVRATAIVAVIALCAPALYLSGATPSATFAAAASTSPATGWYYLNTQAEFAPGSQIAAIQPTDDASGSVDITAMIPRSHGNEVVPTYERAVLSSDTGTWRGHPTASAIPPTAVDDGGVQLVFPDTFPTHYQTTHVKIESDGRVIAHWPGAVPLYASAANPVGARPGALDNQIIGRHGAWLWVALKGPQYPAAPELRHGIFSGFRTWNRIVALNLTNGQYRLYSIPASSAYGSVPTFVMPLAFAASGGQVYIGVHSWLGIFPSNPTKPVHTPIIRPIPAALAAKRASAMLQSLSRREWQEV